MAQVTQKERIYRINQLLTEVIKKAQSGEKSEIIRIDGIGPDPVNCHVIAIGAGELLLNHRSHRIRSFLEDDERWKELKNEPQSEEAQEVLAFYIRDDRGPDNFLALQESILRDGQTNPGLITFDGVIVNGNTRAVAIRDFGDAAKRFIRVAVLPDTVQPHQLILLEHRLQMQKEFKGEYSFTNELLFTEDMREVLKLTPEQIAIERRIQLGSPKKGAAEVEARLQILDLIRKMQQIPDVPLKLRFFDKFAFEQMRDILRNYRARMQEDPDEADRYLKTILLSAVLGVTSVHDLRRIDGAFIEDHMVAHLEEDDIIGKFTNELVASDKISTDAPMPGPSKLLKRKKQSDGSADIDVKKLIDIVTQKNKNIEFTAEAKKVSLDQENVKEALKDSLIVGIREKKLAEKIEDKLSAPADILRKATGELVKCCDAVATAVKDPEFDTRRQKLIELAFKKLKKRYREVETALSKAGIISLE